MTSEEQARKCADELGFRNWPDSLPNAVAIIHRHMDALIESQASEIANLKTNLTNCIEELGELSGPPLSRRVKLILEAKALLAEIKPATASEALS